MNKTLVLSPGRGAQALPLMRAELDHEDPASGVTDDMVAEINALPQVIRPLGKADVIVRGMYWMNDQPMHESDWFVRRFDSAAVAQALPHVRGKPVIANHTPTGRDGLPIGRLFRAGLDQRADGSTWATALFFMLNDLEGQAFARQIDGGIVAENSPTIAYDRLYCSVCGADNLDCEHAPGKSYDGAKCFAVMSDVKDVLEVSLVWAGMQKDTGFYVAAGRDLVDTEDLVRELWAEKAGADEFHEWWESGRFGPSVEADAYWEGMKTA